MDDQALVEGSVVFKDEDDPATETGVRHGRACHKCSGVNRLGSSLNTSHTEGRDRQPSVPTLSGGSRSTCRAQALHSCIPAKVLLLPKPRVCRADIRMQSTAHIPGTAPALHQQQR